MASGEEQLVDGGAIDWPEKPTELAVPLQLFGLGRADVVAPADEMWSGQSLCSGEECVESLRSRFPQVCVGDDVQLVSRSCCGGMPPSPPAAVEAMISPCGGA